MEAILESTNIKINKLNEIFPVIWKYDDLNKTLKRKNNLLKSIIKIVDNLSEEDKFKNVDKARLFKYLNSRLEKLPYDIEKKELNRRIRKIMAVEAMSRILDGLSNEQIEDLVRSFK